MLPETSHYWLRNAHIPACLLGVEPWRPQTSEGLCLTDLEIEDGQFRRFLPAGQIPWDGSDCPQVDLRKKIIFPPFIDIHTHLDKGHIWGRSPNPDGTFDGALETVYQDVARYYGAEDLYRRMEFGLKCSLAHGSAALRTHIDAFGQQGEIGFEVFKQLQREWAERIILQGVCLVSVDYYQTPDGVKLADRMAALGGVLGGVAYQNPQMKAQLTQVLTLAQERRLDLDLHVDETGDPDSRVLYQLALLAQEMNFTGKILCGHCCSLSVQTPEVVRETLTAVKAAGIEIVSLPMCNLYLQGRRPQETPVWRGVTRVHEIREYGVPLAFASDNCRDPFYAFGDHDGLEVLTQSVRIAHLDHPYGDWCASVTRTPAEMMGLPHLGQLTPRQPADFILFPARYFSELFARPQSNRLVVRGGQPLQAALPDYSELDDLIYP